VSARDEFRLADSVCLLLSQRAVMVGGADRDRTGDPLLAKQVLSQLSYSPLLVYASVGPRYCYGTTMVGLGRLELPTSPLSGVRSNHLSYRPKDRALELKMG
jgi:hypothetical protein